MGSPGSASVTFILPLCCGQAQGLSPMSTASQNVEGNPELPGGGHRAGSCTHHPWRCSGTGCHDHMRHGERALVPPSTPPTPLPTPWAAPSSDSDPAGPEDAAQNRSKLDTAGAGGRERACPAQETGATARVHGQGRSVPRPSHPTSPACDQAPQPVSRRLEGGT